MSGTRRGSVSSFGTLELFANLGVEHDDNGDDDEVQVQDREAKERRDKGKEVGGNEEVEEEEENFVTAHSAAAADSKGDIWSFSPPKSASKAERKRTGDVEAGDVEGEGKCEGEGEGSTSDAAADIVVKGIAYVSRCSRRSSSGRSQRRSGRTSSSSLRDSTSEKADPPPGAKAAAVAPSSEAEKQEEDDDGADREAPHHGSRGRLNSSYRAGAHLNASASSTHSDHRDDEGTSPWSMMEEVEAALEASILGTEASKRRWSSGPGGGEGGGDDDDGLPRIESGVVVDRHRPSADRRRTSVGTDDGDADTADAEEAHAVVDIDAAVTDTNVDAIPRDRVVTGGRPGGGRLGGDLARTLGGLFGASKVQDGSGGKDDEDSMRDQRAADTSSSDNDIPLGGALPRDVPSGKVIDPGGGKDVRRQNQGLSSKCWRKIKNNRIWICGVVVAMCLVIAAETAELLLDYKIGGEPTAEVEGEDASATTKEKGEGAVVVAGGPGGGGIRPPSVPPDLYDICSEARVHSSTDNGSDGGSYAACRRVCEGAECCYLPPDHALSCASEEEEEEDPCGIFVRTCAVLDGIAAAAEEQTASANE